MLMSKILLCLFELQVYGPSQDFRYSLKKFEFLKNISIGFAFYNSSSVENMRVNNSLETALDLLFFRFF